MFEFYYQDPNNRTYTTDDDGNVVSVTVYEEDGSVNEYHSSGDSVSYESIDDYLAALDDCFADQEYS